MRFCWLWILMACGCVCPAPVGASDLLGVGNSPTAYVAGRSDGDAHRSGTGGVSWQRRSTGGGDALRGVTHFSGLFVAVGDGGRIVRSSDGGLNWSEMWERQFGGEQVHPDVYYSDQATITLGGKTVELHYTGRNHSDDMTVVLFPEERIIYTVDFLTPKRPPRTTLYGGFFPDWLESLRQVEQLDFDVISPGHELSGLRRVRCPQTDEGTHQQRSRSARHGR